MFSTLLPLILYVATIFRPSSRFFIEPSGIRMAFTERENEISLVWTSANPLYDATVLVRQTSCNGFADASDWTEILAQWQWNFIEISHQWEVNYRVMLQDIYPECEYEYMIGSGLIWTKVKKFQVWTPFRPQSPSQDDFHHVASFLVVGDLGSQGFGDFTRFAIVDFLKTEKTDGLIHLGDIAYNLDDSHPSLSRTYFQEMEVITSTLPYMVLPGNHETKQDFHQYIKDFRMPVNEVNEGKNTFYSFDMGRAHFIAISTEHIYDVSEEVIKPQIDWLKDDLKRADWNRQAVPWIIVMGHRPLYCGFNSYAETNYNPDCTYRAEAIRAVLEELFFTYRVDVVLQAHVHNYQRLSPILRNQTIASEMDDMHAHKNPQAPIYILEGSAGNQEGNDELTPFPAPWIRYQSRELGFSRLTVLNESSLFWEHWDSITGERLDFLSVSKDKLRYCE